MIYHSCVIDNFRLKTVKSNNGGFNWDIVTVSPNQVYGSCEVAKDSNDPTKFYVGGCNFVSDTYDIYHSTGFGEDNFQLVWAVPNVNCALTDNVIRATFAVIHDHPVTLFGRNEGGGRQGIFIYRNILGAERIDEDVTSAALGGVIESYIPTLLYTTGYVVVPYQNRERQCVKVAGFVNNSPIDVRRVGDAPDSNFYGLGCEEDPPGVANIIYSGGNHFQLNSLNKTMVKIPTNGNLLSETGPVGVSGGSSILAEDIFSFGFPPSPETPECFRVSYETNSIGCGEFILPVQTIPTLSKWGLIPMAGVLGIMGLFAIRRRKAAA